ncbi:SCO2521 family protein [Streptomyces sp. NPDC058122]|uniref:SCO2521 family protein n=1 Tax=Streptomyces sp. NPDC058122 TaxID=3346349 RepID=UPI0036F129B0
MTGGTEQVTSGHAALGPPVLACGEVRTCLLPTREALDERAALRVLDLRADERVRASRRPNRLVISPDLLTGVDCGLPTSTGARVRGVGTVTTRAVLTEGRVLQSTASFSIPATGTDRRQAWGYYLARPGSLVTVGRLVGNPVAEGFLAGPRPGFLDVGSIAEGMLARITRHPVLDHDAPLNSTDTRLRWTSTHADAGEEPSSLFTLAEDGLRTLRLRLSHGTPLTAAAVLCEDLALHDWLLTTVADRLDGLRAGSGDVRGTVKVVRPLVDHLLHLWMPRARLDPVLHGTWNHLEETPGYSRQWSALTRRIRDQLALHAIQLPQEVPTPR